MEKFYPEFGDILSWNIKIFNVIGIYSNKSGGIELAKQALRATVLLGFLFGGVVLSELANLFMQIDDVQAAARAAFLVLCNLLTVFKIINVMIHKRRLDALISEIGRKDFKPRTENQRSILNGYIANSRLITRLGCVMVALATSLFAIAPLTVRNGPFLPDSGYLPFTVDTGVVFWVTYCYQSISMFIAGFSCITCDLFTSSLLIALCAQIHVLNDLIENLEEIAREELGTHQSITSETLEIKMMALLVHCVELHRNILGFGKEVTSLFTAVMLGQFFVSVLILCTTLFELSMTDPLTVQFLCMAIYINVMVLEIFLLCYFGNEILLQSLQLTNSAYHCNWLDRSLTFKKILLFFMTNSQGGLKMYAGNFFSLSLEIFVQVMRASISYFTVLYQLSED